ncbi:MULTISPECIES: DNA-directed RNA polymerase subunit beta [unclassified Streptococcus]|uniref:DNA-directed RNA polymerase subunit beta n=1 Tax=unclassified Streptococcus TaxID=2608887 RepID=UPI0011B4253F|nr:MULTISPECIES: DNA-directed RNA polymerase subunit beta [unclassified Streptococcus]TWS95532.1 DNA-directed RNA polymerase subunit beta [Streptococcus sp. sy018]TWT12291.1 DNA-directed RNA polymerase subunit beta [Streptococcus sp. sy004]
MSRRKYVKKQFRLLGLVFLLSLLCFAIGLMIGYAVLGTGRNPLAILSPDKWQAIFDKFAGR